MDCFIKNPSPNWRGIFVLFVTSKVLLNGNGNGCVVRSEHFVNNFLIGSLGEKADDGNEDKADDHCHCAGADRGCENVAKEGRSKLDSGE